MSKKRTFNVVVQTTKVFEITIDENIMNKSALDDFELYVHDLDKENDRIKSMAHDYCLSRAQGEEDCIEGYGYVLEDNKLPKNAEFRGIKEEQVNKAINFKIIKDGKAPNVTVTEIND